MTSQRAIGASTALALALFGAHALNRARNPTMIDDAYMVLRYAKQILAGHGHAWNPDGQQVFGATGTLHLLAVTLFEALTPFKGHTKLALASLGFALAALFVLSRVVLRALRGPLREQPWLVVLGVCLLLVPQSLFISHSLSGMDTMSAFFANSLVAGAALQLARTGSSRALLAAIGAALLALLARPDDGLYAFGAPLLAVVLGGREPRVPTFAKLAGGLAVGLAVYLAIAAAIFGDPLPLPFYAKSIGYFAEYTAARLWNPFEYLTQILWMWLPALAIVTFGVSRRTAPEVVALLAPVALTFLYFFGVVQIMGAGARYYVPATPFAIVAAFVVLDDLTARHDASHEILRSLAARWPVVLILAVTVPAALRDAQVAYGAKLGPESPQFPPLCYERPESGRLPDPDYNAVISELASLAATLPPGTRIALSEHGRLGAAAPQVTLDDLIALHDPEFAHHGFDPEVELARKPDAIWLPHYAFVRLWHDLAADPRLWAEYDVWPDAFLYGFAIRRDSPQRERIYAGFTAIWQRLYPNQDLERWRARRLKSELPECGRNSRVASAYNLLLF